MELRRLGAAGPLVSPVGLGLVKLGRTAGLRLAAPPRLPTDDEALALLRQAADLGVNLLDTAPAYGTSETRLGDLLQRLGRPREAWVLSTKVGEAFDEGAGGSTWDFSPAAIAASVDRSLRRLRTDRLDVVLLHCSGQTDDAAILRAGDAVGALRAEQARGRVGLVGCSVATPAGLALAAETCDVVMLTLNALDMAAAPAAAAAAARGVGVVVKKPLASGHAGDPSASLAAVLAVPGVASAVVGTTSPAHLRDAARAAAAAGQAAGQAPGQAPRPGVTNLLPRPSHNADGVH